MNVVAVLAKDISSKKYSKRRVLNILESFINSDHEAVLLDFSPEEYAGASSCQSTFSRAIKHYGFTGIKCISRDRKVYLIKAAFLSLV